LPRRLRPCLHRRSPRTCNCVSPPPTGKDGETLADADKHAAHEACLRALSDTSSIVQKYQLQEADFDIIGRPKQ